MAEEEYTGSLIEELENTIAKVGVGRAAGFTFEPVVRAALACVPATRGYMVKVREICDRQQGPHGVR